MEESIQNNLNQNTTEPISTISSITSSQQYKKLRRLDSYVDNEKVKLGLETPLIAYGKHYQRTYTKIPRKKRGKCDDIVEIGSVLFWFKLFFLYLIFYY